MTVADAASLGSMAFRCQAFPCHLKPQALSTQGSVHAYNADDVFHGL